LHVWSFDCAPRCGCAARFLGGLDMPCVPIPFSGARERLSKRGLNEAEAGILNGEL